MKYILLIFFTLWSYSQLELNMQSQMFEADVKGKMLQNKELMAEQMPVASTVNPDIYICGPGDFYQLKIVPLPDDELLEVDAEGFITLPRGIGRLKVSGRTLTEVREEVYKLLLAKKSDQQPYLSLVKTRLCMVTVQGNVLNSGINSFPANFRISDVIAFLNKKNKLAASLFDNTLNLNEFKKKTDNFKYFDLYEYPNTIVSENRSITVISETGKINHFDIALSGFDPQNNPYIDQGSTIIIPFERENEKQFVVTGEVNVPSIIKYKEGDNLQKALFLSKGLSESADLKKIEIIRNDGTSEIVGSDSEVEIASSNLVIVHSKEEHIKNEINYISISGEVNNPGTYKFEEGMRLSEVIEKAGGVTSFACLNLGSINNQQYYNNVDFTLNFQELELMQYYDLTVEDTARIMVDALLRKPTTSVDFVAAVNNPGSKNDVKLEAGDYINIPECPNRIYVLGHAIRPGYVEFVPGMNFDYYVDMAGGYSTSADPDRVRIIKGGSFAWIKPDENTIIQQGDIIYIPSEPVESSLLKSQRFTAYTSLVGAVAQIGGFIFQLLTWLDRPQ